MEFRILGELQVVEDGEPLRVDRRLSRALLAYLLLHANIPVSADRLVDELWGPDPPRTAAASLQNYVSRLRRALGAESIRLEPGGYLLRVDPERFDLARFDRLVAEALASPPRQRVELLRAALALWRGEPLEDLSFEEFAQEEIAQLTERRLAAIEERIGAELELGAGTQLVQELEALAAAHPLRSRFRAQLMLALYRAGREADALNAYRAARRTLRDELGLEPSEELRALEQAILRHDPQLLAGGGKSSSQTESRRSVTVVACRLRFADRLDPEVYRRLRTASVNAFRTAVVAHGGSVDELLSDAVLGIFGAPELHEDDALRAVRAAADARKALAGLEEPVAVGLAVSVGEVVAGAHGDGVQVTGAVVDATLQLAVGANAGEILLSDESRRLVGDAIRADAVDCGDGVRGWRFDEVSTASAVPWRFEGPFVGRTRELRRLRTAFARVRRDGSCSVITVVGEAGIGKSRLVRELIASTPEARVLVGRCVPYGVGATYLPLVEIVRQAAGEASVAGVAALLGDADDAAEVGSRIAELIGIGDGPAAIGEAFWAVRRLFAAIARDRPLVVVLDDLHWAEPTLLDLVEYLGRWVDAPLLVLCTARRELLETRPEWGGPTSTGIVIELGPLPAPAAAALVDHLAGGRVEPEVQTRIVARAGGNPLFAEQLLAFAKEAPDVLDRPPPTVEALIGSRLDRLDRCELETLRRASVIGRRFSRVELADLGPVEDPELRGLGRRGLIQATDDGFTFHHVLVRDVAYRGIPKAERAELHERAAEGIDRRGGPDEIVGYHFEQAHAYRVEVSRLDDRTQQLASAGGERLGRAGVRARMRADAPAAQSLLRRAAALLPERDVSRTQLLCELGIAVWAAGEPQRADEIFGEAVATASASRDRGGELRARLEKANLRLFHGEGGAADELLDIADEAFPVFEELRDDRSLSRAWLLVSYIHGGLRCRYARSLEAAERACEYSDRAGWPPSTQQVPAALFHGPTPVTMAIARCESLFADSDRVGEAHLFVYLGGLRTMQGGFEDGRQLADRAEDAYNELGLAVLRSTTLAPVRAEMEMLADDPSTAEKILRESCSAFERMGERVHLATQAAQLADALYAQGDYEDAERWTHLAEAKTSAGDVSAQLSWRSVRAKTRARLGTATEAKALARAAVELAEQTDALNHHGRALLDFAEVLRLDGRADEATICVEHALRLFVRKENNVAAGHARGLLAELAVA